MFQHLKISFSKGNFNEKIKTLCYGCNYTTQKMKSSFFVKNKKKLRISLVNVTKSGNCGFVHIY